MVTSIKLVPVFLDNEELVVVVMFSSSASVSFLLKD